jgi:hypothetical protein
LSDDLVSRLIHHNHLINPRIYVLHEPLICGECGSQVLTHWNGRRDFSGHRALLVVPSDARLQSLKHVNMPITWLVSVVIVLSMPGVGPLQVPPPVGGEAHAAGPGAPTCVEREVISSNQQHPSLSFPPCSPFLLLDLPSFPHPMSFEWGSCHHLLCDALWQDGCLRDVELQASIFFENGLNPRQDLKVYR